MKYKVGDVFLLKTGNGEKVEAKITKYLGDGYYELESSCPFPMTLSERSIQMCSESICQKILN